MQVIIFDYAIVNKLRGCCDLKRSMDCGRYTAYEGAKTAKKQSNSGHFECSEAPCSHPERNEVE
ncbi:MAG: hypothetical protein ACOYIF_09195 [Acetivibrionales bacterium]